MASRAGENASGRSQASAGLPCSCTSEMRRPQNRHEVTKIVTADVRRLCAHAHECQTSQWESAIEAHTRTGTRIAQFPSDMLGIRLRHSCCVHAFVVVCILVSASPLIADTLRWDANTESNLAGYVVHYGIQPGNPTTTRDVGNVTSWPITGLTPGVTYYFRVTAYNTSGQSSAPSSEISYLAPVGGDSTPPTAPGTPTATPASATQINLSWGAATDNVGVTGYRVERCQGASCTSFAQVATPSGTSWSNTGLIASTVYRYRVRAADAAGNLGPYSAVASATTSNATPSTTVTAYGFNEGTGTTTADASGNGNTGTLTNVTWTSGRYGSALSFNGTNSWVAAGVAQLPAANAPQTLSWWAFVTQQSHQCCDHARGGERSPPARRCSLGSAVAW